MREDQFVVVTRYTAPSGHVIVHAYGPFWSRPAARAMRDGIIKENRDRIPEGGHFDVRTCKVIAPFKPEKTPQLHEELSHL
jgi:hypothetical protein